MIVGKYTYGIEHLNLKFECEGGKLTIGSFCSIADNITIFLGGNHSMEWATTYPFGVLHTDIFNKQIIRHGSIHASKFKDITIGNDVWIGGNVTIMSGVTIGDGAVIARNSHVIKNVDPYSIVGGNPSKFIRYRFDDDIRNKLIELKWWDFSDSIINELLPFICSNNFDQLFDIAQQYKK